MEFSRKTALRELRTRKKRSRRTLHAFHIHTIWSDGPNLVHKPLFKDFALSAVTLDQPETLYPEIMQGVTGLAEMPSHRISQILIIYVPDMLSDPFFQRAQGLSHIQHVTRSTPHNIHNVRGGASEMLLNVEG